MVDLVRSYGCTICQKRHYEGESLFTLHINWQSKEGIEVRERYKLIQTDLVDDYKFPDVPKNLKLGEYRRKRDFTKTPEPKGE